MHRLLNLGALTSARLLDPMTKETISEKRLIEVFPPSLAEIEMSQEPWFDVPEVLSAELVGFRPTPIFEAKSFAEALGSESRIFIKDEGATPSGNHKMNSALWIAYHCARDGVRHITTETTGNWGVALARAAATFGIHCTNFIDKASITARPDRVKMMTDAGADVVVVEEDGDPLTLSANGAIDYTRNHEGAYYIFGSVYNYFTAAQTITGIEARDTLGNDDQPDVVIGSCGGGANLLGIAGVFLRDRLLTGEGPRVVCAESELCPIVSKGEWGAYSIDDRTYYPLLETYGLPALLGRDYIGGLGSTIVAAPVADLHQRGLLETMAFTLEEAASAAALFEKTEGKRVALETGFQLAAVARTIATSEPSKVLVNISSVASSSFA